MMASKVIQVWHEDSPGMRVYVKRGWIKRLLYNKRFAHVGEKHLTVEQLEPTKAKALELAKIFHALYERYASSVGYATRVETRAFNPNTPNGRLMQKVCLDLITGGFRLNDTAEDTGPSAADIVSGLRLMPIRVVRAAVPEDNVEGDQTEVELQMHVADAEANATMSLLFSDGQVVYIRLDENTFNVTPAETSRILYELSDYINAQLFTLQSQLRVSAAEFWWKEESVLEMEHRSRQQIPPSVWESTLQDPAFQAQSGITRVSQSEAEPS
ncbi:hypothetical protein [Xanthomonas phage RTH11]|nr:hypothetical protein [Xanthomonas phage RTH11]